MNANTTAPDSTTLDAPPPDVSAPLDPLVPAAVLLLVAVGHGEMVEDLTSCRASDRLRYYVQRLIRIPARE